jgi:hypothetical protein
MRSRPSMIRAVWDLRLAIGAGIRRDYDIHLAFIMSFEIRAVIHFLWLQKLPNVAISRNIDAVYGECFIWLRIIQKWTYHFEEGDDSLEDELRPARPRSTKYCDAIRTLLDENTYPSQKRIASILSIYQTIVKHVLHEDLLFWKVNFKWISHLLHDDRKSDKVRFSIELLRFLESKSER